MTDAHIAKLMWNAYAIQAGGKTFDGKPLPTWDELGDERQSCWIAAASVTADRIEQLEAALTEATAELIYLRLYGCEGAQWSANDCKDVWREKARKALEGKNDADA